jgi:hypothetical protein
MSEYRLGGPAAQRLHVVNAVPAGDHGVDQGEQLAPWAAAPGRSSKSASWSAACSIPSRSASVAGSSSPAPATERSSSNATSARSSTTCDDDTEKGVLRTRAS